MDQVVTLLLACSAALGGVLAFVAARERRGRLLILASVSLIAALLVLVYVAFATGFGDAEGVLDCWPTCSTSQNAMRLAAIFGLPLGVVLLVALAARVVLDKARGGSRD